jgi:hypothetical protein
MWMLSASSRFKWLGRAPFNPAKTLYSRRPKGRLDSRYSPILQAIHKQVQALEDTSFFGVVNDPVNGAAKCYILAATRN